LGFVFALAGSNTGKNLIVALVLILFAGSYSLGLRHLIYYNPPEVSSSIWAGIKDFVVNFFFYAFVALLGAVVIAFPSLLFPVTWTIFPVAPIAETYKGSASGVNWFSLIITPFLYAVTSVAMTYAFLTKNRKNS
jgi:hypothetical protein